MKINPDDLIRQTTAANIRGVSTQAINLLIQRGKLTPVIIDGYTFVFRKEVENYKPSVGGRPKGSRKKARARESR